MLSRIGTKLLQRISSKHWIWKDFNSRKMRKIKWKQPSLFLSYSKGWNFYKMEVRVKIFKHFNKRKITLRFWIVLSAVQELKSALAVNYLRYKHLISKTKEIGTFILWLYFLSKIFLSASIFIHFYFFISEHFRWERMKSWDVEYF